MHLIKNAVKKLFRRLFSFPLFLVGWEKYLRKLACNGDRDISIVLEAFTVM